MFSVSVSYDQDPERTERWLRGEGITPVRSFGEGAPAESSLTERLREAAAAQPRAPFLRLRLDVDQEYARHLRQLDAPRVAEGLEAAVRRTLQTEIPRGAFVLSVRFEGPAADPSAYVLLLPPLDAEWPRRLLSKADIHALEARWDCELQRAFGVRRALDGLQLPEERLPSSPDARRMRELAHQFRHALGEARQAAAARMAGTISQERLRAVVERVQDAQDSLRIARQTLERRTEMPPMETVRLKLERGAELLARLPEKEADQALLRATQRASGLDPRSAEALRLIAYRSGPDLRVTVYFSDAERPARAIDPDALLNNLHERLAAELQHASQRLHPLDRGAPEVGRVEVLDVHGFERGHAPGPPHHTPTAVLRETLETHGAQASFGQLLREESTQRGKSLESPLAKVWERLARAIPAPMRTAYIFARTVGRITPRD